MRAVIPAGISDRPTGQVPAPADGVCFHLRLPLRLLKKRYWLRFCMAKDTQFDSPGSPAPSSRQVVLSITTQAVILTLLFILLVETIFLLYVIKSLFGIDVFSSFHLFS
ncbi:MAG: hypothetical protein JRD84_11450 [Deltaproteobacteria bacterium]|nr:hypothetical protein [Deltaproteobacteria bacterium]